MCVQVLIGVDGVLEIEAAQIETRLELYVKVDNDGDILTMLEREYGLEAVDARAVLATSLKRVG